MKTRILYQLGHRDTFHTGEVELAKSGKWLDFGHWKPRINSLTGGGFTPAMLAEAKAINEAQKALDVRARALNAQIEATQPALLAAAAKAPMSPKAEPVSIKLRLSDDMV